MRVSIQTKLFAAFGVVVALMVVLGVFAVTRLSDDSQHLRKLGSVVVPRTRSVGDINALMNKYRKDQLHYVVAEPKDRPLSAPGSIQGDLNDDLSQMTAALDQYGASGLIEDSADRGLLNKFKADFQRYVTLTADFESLADEGLRQAAADVIGNGPGDHQWDGLKTDIGNWNNHKV